MTRTWHAHAKTLSVILLVLCILGCGSGDDDPPPATGSATLSIPPTVQQTQVWCWAAAAQMVFEHYKIQPLNQNYQCGIVATVYASRGCAADCSQFQCIQPIGPMSNELSVITTQYTSVVRAFLAPNTRDFNARLDFRPLSAQEIKAEIDANRPIIIGISPGSAFALPNASQHVAVIVGYDFTGPTQTVIVNDPYPFPFDPMVNPYINSVTQGSLIQPGRYKVPLASLYGPLVWANTIYGIAPA